MGTVSAQEVVSTDRFLFKILDRAISFQDVNFQTRNLRALDCIYSDALVVQYFGRDFIGNLEAFIKKYPATDEGSRQHLHSHEALLLKTRHFFKMLRYSEDQNKKVSTDLAKLIRQGTRENNCKTQVLYKDTLKTNFISLLEMELYLRSRYEGQMRGSKRNFDVVKPSIDLFVDSLDKQFPHEYYW